MKPFVFVLLASCMVSCAAKKNSYDASGAFEAVETIVSAEAQGKILKLDIEEGQQLESGKEVGWIDPVAISLQKEQVLSSITALGEKTADVSPRLKLIQDQLGVQQAQLTSLLHEQQRVQNLAKADAATQKQLDDIIAQVDVAKKQLVVTNQEIKVVTNSVSTQNKSVLSEKLPLNKRVALLQYQEGKTRIINPVKGVVLTKYAQVYEVTAPGKALYKIADLSSLILRAYISGGQLSLLRLNQNVTVLVDSADGGYKKYPGRVEWISDKAEFTPKTIQTKEERVNLVYAVKIKVPNDGYLKIGMYADVKF